jgi:preprotein translocase subunit SecE
VSKLKVKAMIDKIKLALSLLLLIVGIAGFYLFEDKAMVIRILAVLAGIVASVAVAWTAPQGKQALGFLNESIAEAKRVVWPTRQETLQTTLAVVVLVVIMAAFLALVDIGFAYMVQWIMGRGA